VKRSRLPPVHDLMATLLAQNQFPGAVWLVAQRDKVAVDTAGVTTISGSAPMSRASIYRIASMTKPVTAVAVMMLVVEGRLTLDQPAER